MTTKIFRTRTAPSPTGYLHLGFVRMIIISKIIAQSHKGIYAMRLDDTDRNRLQKDSFSVFMENLEDFGLLPDEGVTTEVNGQKDDFYGLYQKGDLGPYIQSKRLKIYQDHAQNMINRKLVYWSYLTTEDREEAQKLKQQNNQPINWFKLSTDDTRAEEELYANVEIALQDPRKPVLRYKLQRDSVVKCLDEIIGEIEFNLNLEEDPVFLKSDGYPTYHLAHIIDDVLFENTLIIRGVEWLGTFPMHVQAGLDYWGEGKKLIYLHLPHILPTVGNKKMSKRDGNVNADSYLKEGYLPEAIINYFAFLGWNPGTEKELYLEKTDFNLPKTQRIKVLFDNLVQDYKDYNQLTKSNARFDIKKLNWFNSHFIRLMSLNEFVQRAKDFKDMVINSDLNLNQPQILLGYLLDKNRIDKLSEIGLESNCIFNFNSLPLADFAWKKQTLTDSINGLKKVISYCLNQDYFGKFIAQVNLKFQINEEKFVDLLEQINSLGLLIEYHEFATKYFEEDIKKWLVDNNLDFGLHLSTLRLMLSGKMRSPSPFELLAILGLDEAKKRIPNFEKVI
jgi:nondiscriminating glutamyl-tRNA synthetase